MTTNNNLQTTATSRINDILRTQYSGVTALCINSPAGGGKTYLVEMLAVQSMGRLEERVMVVTQTNEQAFDLARRLARGFPRQKFALYVRRDLEVSLDLELLNNLQILRNRREFPTGPCVVIANGARWSWLDMDSVEPFDLQIIDEAFQMPDYRFHQIAGMAKRLILVGDPCQIAPVISIDIERWRCDQAGPHVPCPKALTARYPNVTQMSLPLSRRLVPDTVQFIQPTFYPNLPFQALSTASERRLRLNQNGSTRMDQAINLVEQGSSLVHIELPPKVVGETDLELADTIIALLYRLLQRRATLYINGVEQQLLPSMIGVVCSHISQVNAVCERLPQDLTGVLVETAERFQGLERPIMVAYHPLSGRMYLDQFHLDAGRLCVMLSRHSVAAFLVSRGGLEANINRRVPNADRALGAEEDLEFNGWKANINILRLLRINNRVIKFRKNLISG